MPTSWWIVTIAYMKCNGTSHFMEVSISSKPTGFLGLSWIPSEAAGSKDYFNASWVVDWCTGRLALMMSTCSLAWTLWICRVSTAAEHYNTLQDIIKHHYVSIMKPHETSPNIMKLGSTTQVREWGRVHLPSCDFSPFGHGYGEPLTSAKAGGSMDSGCDIGCGKVPGLLVICRESR